MMCKLIHSSPGQQCSLCLAASSPARTWSCKLLNDVRCEHCFWQAASASAKLRVS